jgi:hypothetical protein
MKKKLVVLFILLSLVLVAVAPVGVLAQAAPGTGGTQTGTSGFNTCQTTAAGTQITSIEGMICKIGQILNSIIPVLIALGVVYFVWGVISYVISSDEEAKKTGRNRIIYGIIGLAVIVAVWGLVNILVRTFGVGGTQNITLPTVQISN